MKKNFFTDKTKKKIKEKRFYIVLAICLLIICTISFTNSISEKPKTPAENKNSDVKYNLPEPIGNSDEESEIVQNTFPPQNEQTPKDLETEKQADIEKETSDESKSDTDSLNPPKEDDLSKEKDASPATAEAQKPLRKIYPPVPGEILMPYSNVPSYQKTTEDWRTHEAIDYFAEVGFEVAAADSGKILKITDSGLFGASIIIDHGNTMQTLYANVSAAPNLKEGDLVTAGDIIGVAENTSLCEKYDKNHIHFEVMINGKNADPTQWIEQ